MTDAEQQFGSIEPGKIKTVKMCDPTITALVFKFEEDDRQFMRFKAEEGAIWGIMTRTGLQLLPSAQADELETIAGRFFAPGGED